eukprot:15324566-Ditylum_brightwellii.AAC.1
MIGTGAAPSTIINIIAIFAQTIAPDAAMEELPKLRYVQHLQTVLYVLGKTMGVIQLLEFDNWDQLFTDTSSIQHLPIQTLINSMTNHDGEIKRSLLGGRGIVLEKGESVVAMCDGIKSTLLNGANNLDGLKSCTAAESLNNGVKEDIMNAACEAWNEDKKLQAELRATNGGNLPDGVEELPDLNELSKYLSAEFKEELAVTSEGFNEAGLEIADSTSTNDNGDHVEATCVNTVRVYKKLMCPEMHYTKGDQMNYKKFLEDNFQGSLHMHFKRACSGTRHDIIANATVPIIVNRPHMLAYLQQCII